ncbi:CJ067-like protein [Mya arenaria]|uniref:CJ067-like protein n=1 Tax=Mya arenaria TaxID=6604 RepID=A0ABY7DAS7_MYAAR|nr:CJ067-like protein [Mya arenaria]
MALLLRDPSGANYGNTEQELQDRILSTDVTEVVDLKEMTEVLQILLRDVDELKRDINLTKHVMQADYESKLRERSLELYCRINERVSDLEKMHEERVGTVRRAFRQQLSDAIARVAVLYNKNLQRKVRQEKSQNESDADLREERYKELQATIQRNESIIQMLKSQIEQLQNNRSQSVSPSLDDSERPSAVTPQTPSYADTPPGSAVTPVRPPSVRERMKSKEVQIEGSLHSKTPSVNYEAEALRDELDAATQRLSSLQDSLQEREDENTKLSKKVDSLDDELTNERMEKEKLRMEIQSIHSALQQDKANSQKMIEKQKEEMEKLMQERLRQAQMQSSQTLEEEAKARQKAEKEKLAFILHALKDESYIRQQLQRQAANLHHAAVSYSVDSPLGIHPTKNRSSVKRPLPEIPKYSKPVNPGATPGGFADKDYISYTVSAPSGRGTAIFSADENQIMSETDREDIPADVVPLPDRPTRNSAPPSKTSSPVKQHKGPVIIVPHVT